MVMFSFGGEYATRNACQEFGCHFAKCLDLLAVSNLFIYCWQPNSVLHHLFVAAIQIIK